MPNRSYRTPHTPLTSANTVAGRYHPSGWPECPFMRLIWCAYAVTLSQAAPAGPGHRAGRELCQERAALLDTTPSVWWADWLRFRARAVFARCYDQLAETSTQHLLTKLGLDPGGSPRVPLWRTRALLRPWWEAGASPVGLVYAIDHHPDYPDDHRGDAFRGADDPLRVLGHRLQPWRGRLTELPPPFAAPLATT